MSNYLTLQGLMKEFRDGKGGVVRAVDHIDLEIEKGELVTFLGPSGCGKTTTLRMIAGFEVQDEGDIFLDGKKINDVAAHERGTPMVFQSYALFPHLSISENVAYGLRRRGEPKTEINRKVEEALNMLQLNGLGKRYPGEISGGQQQRVALARAIVLEPNVMLFDEPLSNLDAKLRQETRANIRRVQQQFGITSIYVTHDQTEALSLSDKIVIMNQGKIVQVDSPMDIYSEPATSFVADFIGNANFFDATVISSKAGKYGLKVEDREFEVPAEVVKDELHEGDVCRVAVKPQHISINHTKQGLSGTAQSSLFVGSFTEHNVEVNGQVITGLESNIDSFSQTLKYGQDVTVWFDADKARVFAG